MELLNNLTMNKILLCASSRIIEESSQSLENYFEVFYVLPILTVDNSQRDFKEPYLKNKFLVNNSKSFSSTIKKIFKHNNIDYIFPTYSDNKIIQIAKLNKKYNLPGVKLFTAKKISDKKKYGKIWEKINIPTPKIYQTVKGLEELSSPSKKIKFPCIVKPVGGGGGVGVKIIESNAQLIDFFKDSDIKKHNWQIKKSNKFKGPSYENFENDYLIQEFIQGDIVSGFGHVINGNTTIDYIYDINSAPAPYPSEIELIFPSKYYSEPFKDQILSFMKKFIKEIELDNCPFMFDLIVDENNQIYFIDFGARASANVQMLLKFTGEQDYYKKLVEAIINNKKISIKGSPVKMKMLPLAPGKIKSIEIKKKNLAEYIKLPNGTIYHAINDNVVLNNGFVIVTGKSLEEIDIKIKDIFESINVIYE